MDNNQKKLVADFIEKQGLDFASGNVVMCLVQACQNEDSEMARKAAWYLNRKIKSMGAAIPVYNVKLKHSL